MDRKFSAFQFNGVKIGKDYLKFILLHLFTCEEIGKMLQADIFFLKSTLSVSKRIGISFDSGIELKNLRDFELNL